MNGDDERKRLREIEKQKEIERLKRLKEMSQDKLLKGEISSMNNRELIESLLFQLITIKNSARSSASVLTTILVIVIIGVIISLF